MNLDLGSFAYGGIVLSGGNTPSWGTSLGQSQPDYKFTYPGADNLLIGMMYCAIPLQCISLPLGKGGRIYTASKTSECQLASLFKKVYINETRIDYPFLMVLIREESTSHTGRRTIKYSDKIAYNDGINQYNNQEFVKQTRVQLGLAEDACWFVYSLEIKNQDELHMYAVVVDANNSVDYPDSQTRRKKWLDLLREDVKILHQTSNYVFDSDEPLQQIYYGAPGTGKSHTIKEVTDAQPKENVFRTTFHPDSDYSTFVGCYKPTTVEVPMRDVTGKIIKENGNDVTENRIVYNFIPQAFTKAYLRAWQTTEPVFLVIEEINRGNCAQIFGDLFQLLDRGEDGFSEYPIKPDADLGRFIAESLTSPVEGTPEAICNGAELSLPANLHIWATMNTSDQSLFPIDSAFKRRWEWKYIPIDTKKENWSIKVGETLYDWSDFLEKINAKIETATSSEDKMLGFYFCKAENGIVSAERFVNKVAFYLWNDVFKDYGFDDAIFNDENGEKITFRKFYKSEGSVDESKVKLFLENLKVESNVTVADGQGEQTDTL